MPMYVYVVVIICFLPPSFSLNYLPRRTLKLNLLVVVVVVLSYIYVYLHISHTFFFFLIPFNKNFYHQPTNQPPQFWLSQNFIHFYKRREDWLPKKIFQLTTDKGGKQQQQQQQH